MAEADGRVEPAERLAGTLEETLGLRHPAVAMAVVVEPPEGIASFTGEVPSACTFWRRAEQGVFFAPAEAHFNCPIGAMTMGFEMPAELRDRLMELVGGICENGYLQADEVANIPAVPGDKRGIVYGPLASFPVEPDAVLVWLTAESAMLLDEATGATLWTAELTGAPTFGRPSCAAIPVAMSRGAPTSSLGCIGMRTYTEIPDDLQLGVLPRAVLPGLRARLERTASVNGEMSAYYAAQKARFPAGAPAG